MRYLIVLLALAGIIVSSLALHAHYDQGVEPCDINSHWDCGTVNHSSYATVPGILWHLMAARHRGQSNRPAAPRNGLPIAALGIVGYALIAFAAFRRQRAVTLVLALVGLVTALYLSNIEAHVLQVWCLYCVMSQFLVALITLSAFIFLFLRPKTA
ncbi:MAG TPA: vitamin K epoxide reductase family protein [Acidobacteriaceae bacterium]|jgi:uncharacterized membrane protein